MHSIVQTKPFPLYLFSTFTTITTMTSLSSIPETFLIISDSHGKCLTPTILTSLYCIKTYSISGLQWINNYNHDLNLLSLIHTDPISSLINSTSNILFLIGINSVRNFPAPEIIQQVDYLLDSLFSRYSRLRQGRIIITSCLPCIKPSNRYSTITLLRHNIEIYNQLLLSLSAKHNVLYLDLSVPFEWLCRDRIHLHHDYHHPFANIIINYLHDLKVHHQSSNKFKYRSREAITRRNRKRNLKFKQIQQNFIISRDITSAWSYYHVNNFLKFSNILYARLLIVSNHTLRLHFNNSLDMLHADQNLPHNIFDSNNFINWIQRNK
ncbi:unnamed protein product [Rotaria sp. Silwood1]|nr:unnamed protein product [Rotaria sp. Silwood1]CAF1688638.1 unnamed protein product [Rotaria sp. Silwood1]CAF4062377.1 unnamed protein product [Rotaria sp. Silwood1]